MVEFAQDVTGSDCGDLGAEKISNRDRVRRLLLDPLGFRFKSGTPVNEQRRRLDVIADDVGYLSDVQLKQLFDVAKTKGEGSAKSFYPSVATFRGWAEVVAPRPLEELPALVSWLASRAGDQARSDASLVALWLWFEKYKIPPHTPDMRDRVRRRAADQHRRLEIIEDRKGRGVFNPDRNPRDAQSAAFERWYRELNAKIEVLIDRLRADRSAD